MRFRATLAPVPMHSSQTTLRYDYQYNIAATFYNILRRANSELAERIHDMNKCKPFTFSRLEIPNRRVTQQGLRILCNDTYLWFSSPDSELVTTIAKGLMDKGGMHFGGLYFQVVRIELMRPPHLEVVECFTTASPIILRIDRQLGDESKTWDLAPNDECFIPSLIANLERKYESYYSKPVDNPIEALELTNTEQKRIWIKNTSHRAHLLDIKLKASEEVMGFAYDAGLGEKTAMGFGMISIRG